MSRFTGSKNRVARRFGTNIFGRARNPLLHKPNPPGQHGARRRKKSDYGTQLEEQQKLRASFGMLTKKQLLKYYQQAMKQEGIPASNFLKLLELRLDIAVYRLKLASTIFQAQQLVSHGHIAVDGRKVDIRSFKIKPEMTISIREKSKMRPRVLESVESVTREVPEYYSFDAKKLSGKLVTMPEDDQIPISQINIPLVCEFLAHTS